MFVFILFLQMALAQGPAEGQKVSTPSAETSKNATPIRLDERQEQGLLQRHHPFYFVYGRPLSKLELSFKTPIIRSWPLYFGYTQYMFWALSEPSKPFRDLTYNPELFYRQQVSNAGLLQSIDLGLWAHNSNGKADEDSRSYDSQYVRFNFERAGRRWTTRAALQLAWLHGFDPTNRDIQTYISPLSLNLSFVQLFDSWFDKSDVSLQVSPGGKFANRWERGGYQLSWSFRLGAIHLVPAFYLQYYRGYAETLLNYNREVNQFRAGVIF